MPEISNNRPKIIFEPSQLEAISDLIKKRISDGTLHEDLADRRVGDFALSIKSKGIATKSSNFNLSTRLNSKELSDLVDRIYIDILSLYKSTDKANNAVDFKSFKSEQQYKSVFDSYLKIKSDSRSFIDGYKNPNYDEIRNISLFDKRNAIKSTDTAIVDPKSNKLTLDGDHTNVASNASLKVSIDSGQYPISTKNIGNIIDPNPNTYWQDVISLESEIDEVSISIKISMSSAQPISTIYVLPFSPQPLIVSNIEHSIDGINWSVIPSFDPSVASQNTDYVSISFPSITARFIRVTLTQKNSIYRNRLIPVSYEEVTSDIFSDRLSQEISLIDFSDYESRSEKIREDMVAAVVEASTLASGPLSEVSGYDYVFGVSDITLVNSIYQSSGEFASAAFSNYKNAFSVKLEANAINTDLSSIEYSIDIGENRRIPIVPIENNNRISNEVLNFSGRSFVSSTRFKLDINKAVYVFENGFPLNPHNFTFDSGSVSLLSFADEFLPNNSNIYTATYSSISGSSVDIHDDLDSIPLDEESFDRTDPNGEVLLSSYPHIEYGVVNDIKNFYYSSGVYQYSGDINTVLGFNSASPSDRIQVPVGSISSINNILYLDGIAYGNTPDTKKFYSPISVYVDDIEARNITNYLGGSQKSLSKSPFGTTIYEYIQLGRSIVFGTRITGKKIRIKYNTMAKHIQLITVLRQISSKDKSITPILKEATLYIKTRSK